MARQVSSCHNCKIFRGYLLCGVFPILCCLSLVLGNDYHVCGVFQQLLLGRLLHHLRTTLPVEGPPNKKKKQPKLGT